MYNIDHFLKLICNKQVHSLTVQQKLFIEHYYKLYYNYILYIITHYNYTIIIIINYTIIMYYT